MFRGLGLILPCRAELSPASCTAKVRLFGVRVGGIPKARRGVPGTASADLLRSCRKACLWIRYWRLPRSRVPGALRFEGPSGAVQPRGPGPATAPHPTLAPGVDIHVVGSHISIKSKKPEDSIGTVGSPMAGSIHVTISFYLLDL